MRCGRGRLSEATRYSRHGATMPAVRSGCPGICFEWSGVGGGRRWMHKLRKARAMCWQDVDSNRARWESDGCVVGVVRSGCCAGWLSVLSARRRCRKPTALDLTAKAQCYSTRLSGPQTASRNVPSRSRFLPSYNSDRRVHLPRPYDKAAPIKKVQIDSLGRPDKCAPTPILPLSPCLEPQLSFDSSDWSARENRSRS